MPQITIDNTTELARYDFAGTSLPTEWNILSQGAGQTVSVASSVMTIAAGTTALAETIVRCTNKVQIKFYSRFIVSLSQRIVDQNIYLELTNAAGTTFARYDFNGTTATSVQCQTGNQGTTNTAVTVTCPTTASYGTFDIYADTNDVVFSSVASNSNAAKSGIAAFDRLVLDPDEEYYLQVRVLNGAVAPASSTNILVDAVVLQDLTGVKVDIIRGDGTGAIANATPVQVMNTHAVTQSGTWTVQPGNTANTTAWLTATVPLTTQGASTHHHLISAATTNATSVKASAGTINGVEVSNASASARYFKLYNKASAPTVGTDTPIKTWLVPANATVALSFAPAGVRCATGIAYALTTGIAVADTTAVGASEMSVNISYT